MTEPRHAKKTESIEVRVAPETKMAFMQACEKRKWSASAAIRSFIDTYIADVNRAPNDHLSKEFDMIRMLSNKKARFAALAACVAVGAALATPSFAADPRVEAVFRWLDANHDNAITKSEFLTSGNSTGPAFRGIEIVVTTKGDTPQNESRVKLFDRMDISRDGKLSLKELDQISTVETILRDPILSADQDGDGKITESELAAHITAKRAEAGDSDPAAGAALMARGVIRAHDGDKDGAVIAEDFSG